MKYLYLAFICTFCNFYKANAFDLDSIKVSNVSAVMVQSRKDPDTLIGIGKIKTKEFDLPQTMILIDEKMIKQQQVATVTDLLKNVNGLYIMGETGGYQEEIASRGTAITSTNTFKNGIRYFGGMKKEFSGIEKVEILKGNSAILFGNVAPGGILNLVTKKPQFANGGSAGMSYGSFNKIKSLFDIYGSLNKKNTIAFRLDASLENANSFRREVTSKTVYLNPSFLFNVTKKTSILIEGDFTNYETTPDFGAGIIDYKIVNLPIDRFLGVSWGKYKAYQSFVSAKFNHQVSKNINISFLSGIRNYNTDLFSNTRPNSTGSIVSENGFWKRNLQRSKINDDYFIQQIDLNLIFKTKKIKHQSLIGADFENYATTTLSYNNYVMYDSINIFNNYNPANEPLVPTLTKNTNTRNPVARKGLYVQDLMTFSKSVKLLVGLRYSDIDSKSNVYKFSDSTISKSFKQDKAFSPKYGLVYQPNEMQTIFASYSNSFVLNTGLDIKGANLNPSIIDQYEVGIKNKLYNNKIFIQLAIYQILNSNLAQISLENGNMNTNIKELTGETKSKGLEIDFIFQPNPYLNITSGYSFSETKYTKSNTYIVGSQLRYNPKHTANVNFSYVFHNTIFNRLQLGLLNSLIGDRYAGRSTRVTVQNDKYQLIHLNSFVLTDFTAAYLFKKVNVKFKLSNVFNVNNYNAHDDNSLNPITPRNYNIGIYYNL